MGADLRTSRRAGGRQLEGAAAQRQGAAIDTLDWKSFIVDAELRRLVDVALITTARCARPSWISRRPARSIESSAPTVLA